MKSILITITLLAYSSISLEAQKSEKYRFDYISSFIQTIDNIFSNIDKSETTKRLKRECIYLISDIDELQIETEILVEQFRKDSADNWFDNRAYYSKQLTLISIKNKSIKERIDKMKTKFYALFKEFEVAPEMDQIGSAISSRRTLLDELERFLDKEGLLWKTSNSEVYDRFFLLEQKAKNAWKLAHELRLSLEKY